MSGVHEKIAAAQREKDAAKKAVADKSAQDAVDQAKKVAALQADGEKQAEKERRRVARDAKREADRIAEEKKRMRGCNKGFWDIGYFGEVDDDGRSKMSWEAFWNANVTVPLRERDPKDYKDYAPSVVARARKLLEQGFSEDTDPCLEKAQREAMQVWAAEEAAIRARLIQALDHETVRTEGYVRHSLTVRFPRADVTPRTGGGGGSDGHSDAEERPFTLFALTNKLELVRALMPRSEPATQTEGVIQAARYGHAAVVREVAEHGVLLPKALGFCLVEAARLGHLRVVQTVMECAERGAARGAGRASSSLSATSTEATAPSHRLRGICDAPWYDAADSGFGVVELALRHAIQLSSGLTKCRFAAIIQELLDGCELGGLCEAGRCLLLCLRSHKPQLSMRLLRRFPYLLQRLEGMALTSAEATGLRTLRFSMWHEIESLQRLRPGRPDFARMPLTDVGLTDKEVLGLQPTDAEITSEFRIGHAEYKVVKTLFERADADHSGYLDAAELKMAMEMALTGNERNVVAQMDPGGEEMDALLHSMDSNDNGQIELVEFVRWWTQAEGDDATEKLNLWWFKDAIKRSYRKKHPPPAVAALVEAECPDQAEAEEDDSDEDDVRSLELGVSAGKVMKF